MFTGIDHVALWTPDLGATIRFWRDLLGLPLVLGMGHDDFQHYFFRVSPTDTVAFFAAPHAEARPYSRAGTSHRGFDHLALQVGSKADLFALRDKLRAATIAVHGPVDHGFGWSIYFHDPAGIPVEATVRDRALSALSDAHPPPAALEGPAPRPEHWPAVTQPTAEADWVASPGAGHALREVSDGSWPTVP